jgi:hypothetical protein
LMTGLAVDTADCRDCDQIIHLESHAHGWCSTTIN